MVGVFDSLSPYFEIVVTIVGLASALYPTSRWIVQQFNKRQERFEIEIKNDIGQSSREIKNVLETAKDDIEEVKTNQSGIRDDVIRVDNKVGKIDEKLDKHIVWVSGATSKMDTQIQNNTNRIERVDNRVDNIYAGLTKRHEEQDEEIKENRSKVNEIADKLRMPKAVKLEIDNQVRRTPYTPFKKKDPNTDEEIEE